MKFIYLAILLMGFSTQSWASGYQLRYQGAESMSTAFASQGSYGNSLSSIYFNPALFLMQSKKQAAAVELFVGHPTQQEFTTGGQSFDDFVSTTFSGSLYYGYMIDDSTAITVALITPWGVKTEYDKNWVGRNFAIKTDLKGINLQPVISKNLMIN